MAGVNVDNVGLTYVHILDGVTETLNQSSKARNRVTQNTDWKGSHIEHKLHIARNHAIKFMNDGSSFPVPDKQDYVSMKVGRKIVGGSIQLTDPVMATAAKSPEVAMDVVASETEGLMKGILKFENFFFFRDGSGKVASAAAAGTPDANYGGVGDTKIAVDDARAFWDGAQYDVYDTTGVTYKGKITVTSVDSAPNASAAYPFTVNVSALGFALAAADKIYWDGAKGIAYTGLDAIIDDSTPIGGGATFQSVTMANAPRWTSMILDAGGTKRDLEPALFRQLQASVYHKTGNDLPVGGLTCFGSAWMLANLDELYEASVRLTSDSKVGGVATPSFQSSLGKITLEADSDAPYYQITLADLSQMYRGVQKKLGWRVQNGSIFLRSDVAPVWTATAIEIAEMYCKGRASSGKILDLNETIKSAY